MTATHRFFSGGHWTNDQVAVILDEFQRKQRGFYLRAAKRLYRSRAAVVGFVKRSGGIQILFSKGVIHDSDS